MQKIESFIAGLRKELERVRWPKKQDLFKSSVITILFIIFFAFYFLGVDALVSLLELLKK